MNSRTLDLINKRIRSDRDDATSYLVAADAFGDEGNPAATALIRAHVEGKQELFEQLLKDTGEQALGVFGGPLRPYVWPTYHHGLWRRLKVGCDYDTAESFPEGTKGVADVLRAALVHPFAVVVEHLGLGLPEGVADGESNWQGVLDALSTTPVPKGLTSVHVGDFTRGDDTEISWAEIGSFAKCWRALPELEQLVIHGGAIVLGEIYAPKLRRLAIQTGGLTKEPLEQLAKAQLPELEDLEIWFGSTNYGCTAVLGDLGPLLARKLPKLRRLGIMNAEFIDTAMEIITGSSLVRSVEVLDLSMGNMTDAGCTALTRCARDLKQCTALKEVNVSKGFLTNEAVEQLREALPDIKVVSNDQQEQGDYVYVSVGE